jgi:hypothetical protein
MSKIAALLGCVLVLTCTVAMSQKRPAKSRTPSSGGSCGGPVSAKGKTGPLTCKASSSVSNPSSPSIVSAYAAVLGRIANQKLGKAMPRPGTPDFVPAMITVWGNQLP